jgi:DNA-binding transcriptional MocR family regulator
MKCLWKPDLGPDTVRTYAAILECLRNDIASGRLHPGDRLPTHRKLARDLGVAVGTISRAYREAERQGLIFGDGRRGTFVGSRTASRRGEPALRPRQAPVVDFSRFFPPAVSDPDLAGALRGIAAGRDAQRLLYYTRAAGWERHRAAGADWIAAMGMKVTADDVVLTSGGQHAIFTILLAVAGKGDIIAADQHIYPGIRFAAEHFGLEVVGIESDREGIMPDALAACCEKRRVRFLYCVPTFNNPTNTVLPESRRHAIAEMAGKYGFEIIEDEISRRLLPESLPLISTLAPERSYLVAPVTKLMGGGVRICYLVAPTEVREKLTRAVHTTTLMVSPILAEIASVWIGDGTADRVMAARIEENRRRNEVAAGIISGLEFTAWPTSYFIWLTLPDSWPVTSFTAEAQTRGVLVAPACCFAVDPLREANAVRICFGAARDIETLKRALGILMGVIRGQSNVESIVL